MVEDVNDINGKGAPLYGKWELEDWTLMNIRWEFHLLIHSFVNDVKDDAHVGVFMDLLPHYYELYYKRAFFAPQYGCENLSLLVTMLQDTVSFNKKNKIVGPELPIETPYAIFVKLTEESRRERVARIEAGDESAKLSFAQPTASAIRPNRDSKGKPMNQSSGKGAKKGGGGGSSPQKQFKQNAPSRPAPTYNRTQYDSQRSNYGNSAGGYGVASDRLRENLMRGTVTANPSIRGSYGVVNSGYPQRTAPGYGGFSHAQTGYAQSSGYKRGFESSAMTDSKRLRGGDYSRVVSYRR